MDSDPRMYSLTQELNWKEYDDDSTYITNVAETNVPETTTTVPETDEIDSAMIQRSMSVSDVSSFLLRHGIPETFCKVFKGIYLFSVTIG